MIYYIGETYLLNLMSVLLVFLFRLSLSNATIYFSSERGSPRLFLHYLSKNIISVGPMKTCLLNGFI